MTEFDPRNPPAEFFIADEKGLPIGHIDVDKLQSDATLLMYDLAETAGDDEATDRVAEKWVTATDPQYYSYLAAAALSLTVRHVLAPSLDVAQRAGIDLRAGLRRAAAYARRDLGGPS
ncbi:hypothetical protein [Tsukamurella hominis]|uniref:hypothetical protein n=1 Tax=Tsukamurella hominis TaxID=1970232 RepID=UPI0039EB9897